VKAIPKISLCALVATVLSACTSPSFSTATPSPKPTAAPLLPPSPPSASADPIQFEDETTIMRPTRRPTLAPTPSPTPLFNWPEETDPLDAPALLAFVQSQYGPPDMILFRNGGLGWETDAGVDYSTRVSFETRFVYEQRHTDFSVTSYPHFRPTGRFTGTANLCLRCTEGEGAYCPFVQFLTVQTSDIPQEHVLYRDLAEQTGLSSAVLFERLLRPDSCSLVPVSLPHSAPSLTSKSAPAYFPAQPADCQLPCWNSLTPALSAASDIPSFFERLGVEPGDITIRPSDLPGYTVSTAFFESFPYTFPDLPPEVSVFSDADRVVAVELSGLDLSFITTADIIKDLGPPEQIYLGNDAGAQGAYFTLLLRYPHHQAAIFINGAITLRQEGNEPLICLTPEMASTTLLAYSGPAAVLTELSMVNEYPVADNDMGERFFSWIKASDSSSQPTSPSYPSLAEITDTLMEPAPCLPLP